MKMLFLAPSRLSKEDAAIAADLARELPRKRVRAGFLAAAESLPQLHDLGMPALALTGNPAENLAMLDRAMTGLRPDLVVAADAFAVDGSRDWSGLTMGLLRERYDCPVASIDRLGWPAADYAADPYGGGASVPVPRLLDDCDVIIQTCPPHAPKPGGSVVPGGPAVVQAALHRGGLRDGGLRAVALADATPGAGPPVVFIANAEWEYRNPSQSPAVARLIEALPAIVHNHLAALGRPLKVTHVGPRPWSFPTADQVEYQHFSKLPYPLFHARLAAADLFLTTDLLSSTLGRAVLAGVPSLLLQNGSTVDDVPDLGPAYPFRVAPLGWHALLEPLLTGNPYRDCFATAEIFDRDDVTGQLSALLDHDDGGALRERQDSFRTSLADLPQPLDALKAVLAR